MEHALAKNGRDSHYTSSLQTLSIWLTRHRKTVKKVEGNIKILVVGTGDSPNP
jgi:hypothetical protein